MLLNCHCPPQDEEYAHQLQYQFNYEDSLLDLSGAGVMNDQTSGQDQEFALTLQLIQVQYTLQLFWCIFHSSYSSWI